VVTGRIIIVWNFKPLLYLESRGVPQFDWSKANREGGTLYDMRLLGQPQTSRARDRIAF
jgi:hypothetical protein